MWLFTRYGFFSVVCPKKNNGESEETDAEAVMIRARSRKHLENLINRFPEHLNGLEIKESKRTDYGYRIFVSKTVWSDVASKLANEIDYSNFKGVCDEDSLQDGDDTYIAALHDVWFVMARHFGAYGKPPFSFNY